MRFWAGEDARELARSGIEVWARCPGADAYAVSNLGRVYSTKREKILKVTTSGSGYPGVSLPEGKVFAPRYVHRLVLEAFDGPPAPGAQARHYPDPDKENIALVNLRWGTGGENMADCLEQRRAGVEPENQRVGELNHRALSSEQEIVEGLQQYVENQWSGVKFAQEMGIHQATAHQILSGASWKHIPRPGGFQYPWPNARSRFALSGASHPSAKMTEEQVLSLFSRIVASEFETVKQVMTDTGLKKSPAHNLLNGKSWKKVPRPEGFEEAVARMKSAGNRARGKKNKSKAKTEQS